jgi:hypothetical protein
MHVPLINATPELENVCTLQWQQRIQIAAPPKPVIKPKDSSTPQRTVTMELLAQSIPVFQAVVATTLQTMLFVTTKILAPLMFVLLERDA